jgi:hypothetical protein
VCRSHTVIGMNTLLSAVGCLLSFRVRSRASLELELVALRHQLTVLRRQHPASLGSSPPTDGSGCGFTESGRRSSTPWFWSNRQLCSTGIVKDSDSTGGGGHATWDGPG